MELTCSNRVQGRSRATSTWHLGWDWDPAALAPLTVEWLLVGWWFAIYPKMLVKGQRWWVPGKSLYSLPLYHYKGRPDKGNITSNLEAPRYGISGP